MARNQFLRPTSSLRPMAIRVISRSEPTVTKTVRVQRNLRKPRCSSPTRSKAWRDLDTGAAKAADRLNSPRLPDPVDLPASHHNQSGWGHERGLRDP
jgi:hypothetical protein